MTSEEDPDKPTTDNKQDVKQEDEKKVGDDVVNSVTERLKFFFSDANIRQDYFIRKFLMVRHDNDEKDEKGVDQNKKEDEKEDEDSSTNGAGSGGSIPVEVLLRFNTIKQHTTDPGVIVKVVKTQMSDTLQMQNHDKDVARVRPFTDKLLNGNIPLSLYVKNIPAKEIELETSRKKVKHYAVSIDEIRGLFESYGKVALVKLRYKVSAHSRDEDHTDDIKVEDPDHPPSKKAPRRKYPIGACLIEFETNESLERAAADVLTTKHGETVEPKRKLELRGESLIVQLLKDYVDKIQSRKRDREDKVDNTNGRNRGSNDGADDFTIDWKPGCVLSLKGLPESCDREAIVDAAMEACEMDKSGQEKRCIYADFSRGQKDGAVRLENPDLACKLVEKLNSGAVKISGSKIEEAELLEGEEEKAYWANFIEFKKRQIRHRSEERSMKHRNKKRRGRGF